MDILVTEGEPTMGLRAHHPAKGQPFRVVKENAVRTSWAQFARRAHETILSAITLIGLAMFIDGISHLLH